MHHAMQSQMSNIHAATSTAIAPVKLCLSLKMRPLSPKSYQPNASHNDLALQYLIKGNCAHMKCHANSKPSQC